MSTPDYDDQPSTSRSPGLAVMGVAALAVAGWGLSGGPSLPDVSVLPWLLVTLGLLAGIALVASGFRR